MRLTENTKIRIKVPKSLYEAIQAELDTKHGMEEAVSGKAEELKGFYLKVKEQRDGGTDLDSAITFVMNDLGMDPMMETKKADKSLKEAFEVHFSDGVRQSKKFKDEKSALSFAKELISTNKNLQNVDVFMAGPNFNSTADTESVIAWWGPGSFMDNKSKKDAKLAAKKIKAEM